MNLSSAIDYLTSDKKYLQRQLSPKMREALELVLEVLQENVNVEEWDTAYYEHGAMCQHCSGNGCASCKGTGEAKILKKNNQVAELVDARGNGHPLETMLQVRILS